MFLTLFLWSPPQISLGPDRWSIAFLLSNQTNHFRSTSLQQEPGSNNPLSVGGFWDGGSPQSRVEPLETVVEENEGSRAEALALTDIASPFTVVNFTILVMTASAWEPGWLVVPK